MATPQLTKNAIPQILQGVDVQKPVLQVLAYKSVPPDGDSQQRVRFILSDGDHSHQCCIMVGPQNVARVENGEFERHAIVQLNGYICNNVNNRKVIIMSEPKLLKAGKEVGARIGAPVNIQNVNGGDVKPNVDNLPANPVKVENGGGAASSSAVKRPNGTANSFAGPSSSPKRVRPATNSQIVVIPISALNPFQNRWIVKGRVTSKGSVRTWHNARGEGKLFSFDLKDDSGEIKFTSFNQECDRFAPIVEIGKVLRVSRGQVKNANKRFCNSDYEVTLGTDSTVEEDLDDNECPEVEYNFMPIKDVENMEQNSVIDVAGIIRKVDDAATLIQKTTQKELTKRDVTIVDESEAEIKMTLWGLEAANFSGMPGGVMFVRGAKVSDYNGKSLNASFGSSIQIDPNHQIATRLSEWYGRIQDMINPKSLSGTTMAGTDPVKFLYQAHAEVVQQKQNSSAKPLYFVSRVFVGQMGRTNSYKACKICRSKVTDMNNGTYKCYKCSKETEYEDRLIQSVCLADDTHEVWASAFHDEAVELTGKTAEELLTLRDSDEQGYQDLLLSLNFKSYMAKLKCHNETYKEEERVKTSILRLEPLDYVAYSRQLLERIKAMTIQ